MNNRTHRKGRQTYTCLTQQPHKNNMILYPASSQKQYDAHKQPIYIRTKQAPFIKVSFILMWWILWRYCDCLVNFISDYVLRMSLFQNVTVGIADPSVFDVPSICNQASQNQKVQTIQ